MLQPAPFHQTIVNRFGALSAPWMKWFRDAQELLQRLKWLEETNPGYFNRACFEYNMTHIVDIKPGLYLLSGVGTVAVWWNETLEFEFGPSGSNSESATVENVADIHYIYIDYSAITHNVIDETCFYNDTTIPTYDSTKAGWYNGNDRAIFAIRTSMGDIAKFRQDRHCIIYDTIIQSGTIEATSSLDQTVQLTEEVPEVCEVADMIFIGRTDYGGTSTPTGQQVYVRAKEYDSGAAGRYVLSLTQGCGHVVSWVKMPLALYGGVPTIQAQFTNSMTYTDCVIQVAGYYLPEGM
jgi:hypothetical protein